MSLEIWNHSDYRDYLKQLFCIHKEQNSRFSYQYCALKLETSRSYLKLILDKSRHINASKLGPLSQLFKLGPFEKQVLVFLFLKTIVDDPDLRKYCKKTLKTMGAQYNDKTFNKLNIDKLSGPYHTECLQILIDAIADLPNFQKDVDWIQDHLVGKWAKKHIRQVLNKLSLIDKNENITMTRLVPGDVESFRNYQIGLDLSSKAITDPYQYRPCNFNMIALALADEQADILIEKMNELRDLAFEMAKEKRGEQVYFISNNFFTVSKKQSWPSEAENNSRFLSNRRSR